MNIFTFSNFIAWILTAIVAVSLLVDFFKTETSNKNIDSDRKIPYEKR